MNKINFKDGQLVSPAYLKEDGTIEEAVYQGETPLSSYMLNKMQDNAEEAIEDTEPTSVASGNNIHIENALEAELVELKLEGKSEQATRSGKNNMNLKNIAQQSNCTVVVDDEKLTVTATGTGNPMVEINCSLEAGGHYLHLDKPVSDFNVSFYNNSGTKIGSNINTSNTFTLSEKAVSMRINSSASEGNYNLPFESLYINKGNTDLGYEQYGASPSPEFPSPIENVEGWNKFDKNSVTNGYYLNESGNLIVSANYCVSDFIKVEEGEKYFIPKRNTSRTKYYLSDKTAYSSTWDVSDAAQVITIPAGVKYIRFTILIAGSGAVDLNTFQFTEGSEEKPYAPYNSLVIEDVGKNLFDNDTRSILGTGSKEEKIETGIRVTALANGQFLYRGFNLDLNKVLGKEIVIKSDIIASSNNKPAIILYWHKNGTLVNRIALQELMLNNSGSASIRLPERIPSTVDANGLAILLYANQDGTANVGDYVDYTNLIVCVGNATDYEPYKSQTEAFPLAENQKLMHDSYIADDGIHHKRKQVIYDGSDDEQWAAYPQYSGEGFCYQITDNSFRIIPNEICYTGGSSICSHFKHVYACWDKTYGKIGKFSDHWTVHRKYFISDKPTLAEFKAWLSENPITLEYELAEEVIEPFTTEQQTAWNNIKAMKLFERSKQY